MGDFEKQLTELVAKIRQGNGQTPHTLASLRFGKGVTICSSLDACCAGTRVEIESPRTSCYVFESAGGSEGADMDDGSVLYYTHFYLVGSIQS